MNFENKTVAEIDALIVASFEENFNKKFRLLPKSFLRILSKVLAGLYVSICKMVGWMALQIFPDTAANENVTILGKSFNPLANWAEVVGANPKLEATNCKLKVSCEIVANGILYEGTQLKSAMSGKIYSVSETVSVATKDKTANFEVECAESGTAGNLEVGDEIKFVSPVGFLDDTAKVESVVEVARDEESDESWREKIVAKMKLRPQGGALADYREWALEVPGVKDVYVYTIGDGGVKIFVQADESITGKRTADRELCVAVGKSCSFDKETGLATRKPLTAVLDPDADESFKNIVSCQEVAFWVRIGGLNDATLKSEITKQIKDYFLEREPFVLGMSLISESERKDWVDVNQITGIVNDVCKANGAMFDSVILYQGISTLLKKQQLKDGELAYCEVILFVG